MNYCRREDEGEFPCPRQCYKCRIFEKENTTEEPQEDDGSLDIQNNE